MKDRSLLLFIILFFAGLPAGWAAVISPPCNFTQVPGIKSTSGLSIIPDKSSSQEESFQNSDNLPLNSLERRQRKIKSGQRFNNSQIWLSSSAGSPSLCESHNSFLVRKVLNFHLYHAPWMTKDRRVWYRSFIC